MPKGSGWERWLLAGVCLLGAALRFATLDVQSYGHDEAVTAGRVLLPGLLETVSAAVEGERSPPVYYVLAWVWTQPFGAGEVGLRSLSALLGAATITAAWWAGRELVSPRVGLIAAAFVAANPYLAWYSQEGRSYALAVLLVAVSFGAFARVRQRAGEHGLALWAAASMLAVASHYFAAFVIAPMALLILRYRRARWALGAVGAATLALLVLAITQEGTDRANRFTELPVLERFTDAIVKLSAGEEPDPLAGSAPVDVLQVTSTGLLVAALVVSAYLVRRFGTQRERKGAMLAGTVAAAGLAAPLALALVGVDYLIPRNLIVAAVPALIYAGCGFGSAGAPIPARLAAVALSASLLAVLSAPVISEQMRRPDWRGVAKAIGSSDQARLVVTNANGDDPLLLYLDRARRFGTTAFPSGIRTCEVVVVSVNTRPAAPPGFRLDPQGRLAPRFFVWRLVAPRPRRVRARDLIGGRVLSERSRALAQSATKPVCPPGG